MSIPILDKPHNKQLIINNLKHYKIMKATNNNVDTLFMDIFVELFAIAKVYFQELFKNADPGTYTIKDIYAFIEKNIEATKEGKLTGVNPYFSDRYKKTLEKSPYYTKVNSFEKYTISYLCRVTDNIVSIEKENFKCSFDIIKVFEYLERFKKLSGAKDKLEFTKETEIKEGQKATSFEVELSKEDIKSLISVKTDKKNIENRYTENAVHLSLTDSTIYATDCFVLKAKRVDTKNVLGEIKDILIPFDVLKNIGAGKCEFTVIEEKQKFEYEEEEKTIYKVAVKNTATNKIVSYSFKKVERFYNYKSIYPELYKEMNICLKDTKSFADCIKTQQKLCKEFGLSYFMIQVIKGSKKIKVITCNEVYDINDDYKFSELSFELKESAEFSGDYFYVFGKILKCLNDWNGNLYFDETKLSFGIKAVDTCFCIGALDINKYFNKYSIVTIKPDKLTKIEIDAISGQSNNNVSLDNCDKQNKNHLDAIYKDTLKEGDYVEFNLSCNADAPTYIGFISNDPGLGLVCVVDGQKIEVRKMVNLKVLKPKEGKTVSPIQSEKESSLNDKERGETKQIERDNSIQPKGTKPTMQYTDDMLELVSLDLNSMTYVVNGDIGTAKNIQSIVLYDEIGKIVVSCDDGKKIECQFDGESILQSVLKEM